MPIQLDHNLQDFESRARPAALVEINMTPFVDVCLVLLIIFMVTAPFVISGVNVKLPETQVQRINMSDEPLVLTVTQQGLFYIEKKQILEKNLVTTLQEAQGKQKKSIIFIRADKSVPYGKVMTAMTAAQLSGIQKIGMIGENKPEK